MIDYSIFSEIEDECDLMETLEQLSHRADTHIVHEATWAALLLIKALEAERKTLNAWWSMVPSDVRKRVLHEVLDPAYN